MVNPGLSGISLFGSVKSVRSCEEVLHSHEKPTHVEVVVKGLLQLNLSLGASLGHICDI